MLSNPETFKGIKDHVELAAKVSEVSVKADDQKAKKKQSREKDTLERQEIKNSSAETEARKKEDIVPLLNSDVNKCTNRAREVECNELIKEMKQEVKLPYLKELFVHYYGIK